VLFFTPGIGPTISQWDLLRSARRASRSQALWVDRQRNRDVAADEDRPQHVRLKTPQPVVAEHALRFEIGDHRGRPCPLKRRAAVSAVEAHHPDRPGAPCVVPEYPGIVYQVTRGGSTALPAPGIEGADLLLSLEPGTRCSGRERVASSHPINHPGTSAQARPTRQVDGALGPASHGFRDRVHLRYHSEKAQEG
jgi:hypothetical protein